VQVLRYRQLRPVPAELVQRQVELRHPSAPRVVVARSRLGMGGQPGEGVGVRAHLGGVEAGRGGGGGGPASPSPAGPAGEGGGRGSAYPPGSSARTSRAHTNSTKSAKTGHSTAYP